MGFRCMKLQKPPRVHSLGESQTVVTPCAPSPPPSPLQPGCPHLPHFVLAAAGFSEVGHRGQLGVDGLPVEPAVVQVNHSLLRVFLAAELKRRDGNACHPHRNSHGLSVTDPP